MRNKPTGWNWGGDGIAHTVILKTQLPIFRTRHKKELEKLPLFEWANIHVGQDDIDDNVDERMDIVGYEDYDMVLPYTQAQWERRQARLAKGVVG